MTLLVWARNVRGSEIDVVGADCAVGFLQNALYSEFGTLEQLARCFEFTNTFFKQFERLVEVEFVGLERTHDCFETVNLLAE